jgi:hypothetical protein
MFVPDEIIVLKIKRFGFQGVALIREKIGAKTERERERA